MQIWSEDAGDAGGAGKKSKPVNGTPPSNLMKVSGWWGGAGWANGGSRHPPTPPFPGPIATDDLTADLVPGPFTPPSIA